MLTGYYKKNKERLSKKICESYQNLSEEEKTKSVNILMSDKKIFLKKKRRRSVNMVVTNIKFFY